MNRLTRWADEMVERLCHWLNAVVSSKRRLALLGNGMAGVNGGTPLPVDRRHGPMVVQTNWDNRYENATPYQALPPVHGKSPSGNDEGECGFWAYCHLKGDLCVHCGGKNALTPGAYGGNFTWAGKALCPEGKYGGQAWFGCCLDPTGKGRLIAFLDCCGHNLIPCGHLFWDDCENWPEAKSWCVEGPPQTETYDGKDHAYYPASQKNPYYCTVVLDMNGDKSCN
jgi:hypothetical protein